MELSRDGDQAIRILPLIDFLEESGKPAEPHKSTIFGVSIDANILHRDDKLYKRSNYEQFGCSELFTHFPVILQKFLLLLNSGQKKRGSSYDPLRSF